MVKMRLHWQISSPPQITCNLVTLRSLSLLATSRHCWCPSTPFTPPPPRPLSSPPPPEGAGHRRQSEISECQFCCLPNRESLCGVLSNHVTSSLTMPNSLSIVLKWYLKKPGRSNSCLKSLRVTWPTGRGRLQQERLRRIEDGP